MTNRYYPALVLPLAAATLLTGCVDDKYDLGNIDTTSRVEVKDLIVPVNLAPVTLNSVIDIKDDENIIKEDYTGDIEALQGKQIFVFRNTGTFSSEPIHLSSFHVNSPKDIDDGKVPVYIVAVPAARKKGASAREALHYEIKSIEKPFTYHIDNIDKKVMSVKSLGVNGVTFTTKMFLPAELLNTIEEINITDLRLSFPKSLTMENGKPAEVVIDGVKGLGSYDPATGIVTVPSYTVTSAQWSIALRAEVIGMESQDVIVNHAFDYKGSMDVLDGYLDLVPRAGIVLPTSFYLDSQYDLSSFDIAYFSGGIDYTLDNFAFDDVKLNNLPEFLSQDNTRLNLANPQLYISLENTCAKYGLSGSTGLAVTPHWESGASKTLTMETTINVGTNLGEGPYKFAVAPAPWGTYTPAVGYENATPELFSQLGEVLYGDGIPETISVDFTDAKVDGEAEKFPLQLPGDSKDKWEINPVAGTYEFRAPLALADGSQIYYSGTDSEWDSDVLSDLHIKKIELNAVVSSIVPLDVNLSAYLLNKEGIRMGVCEATVVKAMAENEPIVITITPNEGYEDLTGIDGIYYEVTAISNATEQDPTQVPALSPEMTLTLDNIKARINGYYEYVDDDYEPNN